MKVALVTNFPAFSGTGKVTYKVWQELKKDPQIQADLFLTQFIRSRERLLPENVGVRTLLPFDYLAAPFLSRALLYFVDPFLVPSSYDVYHFGNHMIGRFVKFRRPSVVTVHDLLQYYYPEVFESRLVSKIYNHFFMESIRSASLADHIICVSEYARDEVFKYFKNVNPEKVSVVYNGVNHQTFYPRLQDEARSRLRLPKKGPVILNVGSEIRKKQIPLLLTSFKLLKKEFPRALLLRCGERTESVERLIRELGLEDDVCYKEFFDEEDLAWVYSAADVYVQTSSEEGFGLPVVEAMACGVPVVSSDRTSLREACGGAQAAVLENFDEVELASCLSRVSRASLPEREIFRKKGFANAARFSWEKTARETLSVYRKVLKL